jgi:hypothetical protein
MGVDRMDRMDRLSKVVAIVGYGVMLFGFMFSLMICVGRIAWMFLGD